MSTPNASDLCTPPRSPAPGVPKGNAAPNSKPICTYEIADLGQQSQSTAAKSTSRLAPREEKHAARDAPNCDTKEGAAPNALRASSIFAGRKPSVLTIKRPSPLHNGYTNQVRQGPSQKKRFDFLQRLMKVTNTYLDRPPIEVKYTQSYLTDLLRGGGSRPNMKNKRPLDAEAREWNANIRRKRSPSELFSMSFSFESPSKCKVEDRTPPTSPHGTTYSHDALLPLPPWVPLDEGSCSGSDSEAAFPPSAAQSSPLPIPDAPKRPRMDSSTFDFLASFYAKHGWPKHSPPPSFPNGFSLRDQPPTPDTAWLWQGERKKLSIEPHPGVLVDFSTPKRELRSFIPGTSLPRTPVNLPGVRTSLKDVASETLRHDSQTSSGDSIRRSAHRKPPHPSRQARRSIDKDFLYRYAARREREMLQEQRHKVNDTKSDEDEESLKRQEIEEEKAARDIAIINKAILDGQQPGGFLEHEADTPLDELRTCLLSEPGFPIADRIRAHRRGLPPPPAFRELDRISKTESVPEPLRFKTSICSEPALSASSTRTSSEIEPQELSTPSSLPSGTQFTTFLESIRQIKEERARTEETKRKFNENPVFKDESRNGFLGDEPF